MRQPHRFPAEIGHKAFIDLQSQRVVILFAHQLTEIASGPEREDVAEGRPGFRADVVGVQVTFVDGLEFAPGHGALGIGKDDHAAVGIGGCGAGQQLAFGDQRLFVAHEIFKGQALTQDRLPGPALMVVFKTVAAVPFGQQDRALGAEFRARFQVPVQQVLQAWKIVQSIFGKVGVFKVADIFIMGFVGLEVLFVAIPEFTGQFGVIDTVFFSAGLHVRGMGPVQGALLLPAHQQGDVEIEELQIGHVAADHDFVAQHHVEDFVGRHRGHFLQDNIIPGDQDHVVVFAAAGGHPDTAVIEDNGLGNTLILGADPHAEVDPAVGVAHMAFQVC